MSDVVNFSAGPAMLPRPVLERAQLELLDWNRLGVSVVEVSHRSKEFVALADGLEARLRGLMAIPDNYRVLFLQGGAQLQFAAVPLNLAARGARSAYVDTGSWSTKAIEEARQYTEVHIAASSESDGYLSIPDTATWDVPSDCGYLHYTPNETIGGVEFHSVPELSGSAAGVPLVADMSSNILSAPLDVSKHGVIYAGAQKNIGISGLTLVIVRDDLLEHASERTPTVINFKRQAKADSMANTPCTFAWYIADLVFEWIHEQGGVEAISARNRRKSAMLYEAIDGSNFYTNNIGSDVRSHMNVTFSLADSELDKSFLAFTEERGLIGLKGHRQVGGMRASIYNAMPESGVERLVEAMHDFVSARASV